MDIIDVIDVECIIENYVNMFRKLLIILLKNDKINIKEKKKYNYCLHLNYKGKKCKRRVKAPGELCIFHKKETNGKKDDFDSSLSKNIDNKESFNENVKNNLLDKNNNLFNEFKDKFLEEKIDNGIDNPSDISLDKDKNSFETENKKVNEHILSNEINNPLIDSLDELNASPEKINLLNIMNTENNKLICCKCKKALITHQELDRKICNYCNNSLFPSRKKTLIKCKKCNNNTLNIDRICNNCLNKSNGTDDKTICPCCNLFKIENQKLCRKCYKKQKRKVRILN